MTKRRLIIFLQPFVWLFALSSCLTYVNSSDFERTLNSKIGTKVNLPIYLRDGWKKINEDEDSFELEATLSNGCSYSYKIEKAGGTVVSWRFISERNKCDNVYVPAA